MNIKLLKRLRRKAERRYKVVETSNGNYEIGCKDYDYAYMSPSSHYLYSCMDYAKDDCNWFRREYIFECVKKLRLKYKKHKINKYPKIVY